MPAPTLRPFEPRDIDWLVAEHAAHYARSDGFDAGFGVLVRKILTDFSAQHDPAREAGWLAQTGGTRLGTIFCVASDAPDCAKLRLFYLVEDARGTGLGRKLLTTCTGFARRAGYREVRLWTHESHRAATALYARTGFLLEESRPAHSFGVHVTEQMWSLRL